MSTRPVPAFTGPLNGPSSGPLAAGASAWAVGAAKVVAVAVVMLATCTANAALLFPGALEAHLPQAVGAVVVGAALLMLTSTAGHRLRVVSNGPDSTTAPVLAALSASIVAAVPGPSALPTVLAALALAGLLMALIWLLIGRTRLADGVRNIPFPVVGGFVCSNGWLLVIGGLGVVAGERLDLLHAPTWIAANATAPVALTLAFGLCVLWAVRRWPHQFLLPAIIAVVTAGAHLALAAAGLDAAAAQQQGWLMPDVAPAFPSWAFDAAIWAAVDAQALLTQAPLMAALLVVATLSYMLSMSNIERGFGVVRPPGENLKAAGLAGLMASLVGGIPGGISMSNSLIAHRAAPQRRFLIVGPALSCLAVVLTGAAALWVVPRPLIGGLLVYMGLAVLYTWLVERRASMPRRDYAVVVALMALTVTLGFIVAVAAGVLWCCLEFVWSAARRSPVRRVIDRSAWPTHVERSQPEMARLLTAGRSLTVVELEGTLFFGSGIPLRRMMDQLLGAPVPQEATAAEQGPPLPRRRLLFDFHRVTAVDLSAAQTLVDVFRQAAQAGVEVELAVGPPGAPRADRVRQVLQRCGAFHAPVRAAHADAETAIAAWDDAVLAAAPLPPFELTAWLAGQLPPGSPAATDLLQAFEAVALPAGATLFEGGDPADAMYLVQRGRLEAVVPVSGGEVRVRILQPGGCLGEMGLLRGGLRTATVRAMEDSELLRLDKRRLAELHEREPAHAAALYRLVIGQMAGRIDQLTAQVSR